MRACDYHVYRIRYNNIYAERVSTCGGMDSELTGLKIKKERNYLCIAPDESFATTAFQRYHSKDEFLAIEHLGLLDDMVYLQ